MTSTRSKMEQLQISETQAHASPYDVGGLLSVRAMRRSLLDCSEQVAKLRTLFRSVPVQRQIIMTFVGRGLPKPALTSAFYVP